MPSKGLCREGKNPIYMPVVAIMRPAQYIEDARKILEKSGFRVIAAPFIELKENPSGELEKFVMSLESKKVDVGIFTSRTGAKIVLKHVESDLLKNLEIIAIGPKTASVLIDAGLDVYVPEKYSSKDLFEEIKERISGKNVFLLRSNYGDPVLYRLRDYCHLEEIVLYTIGPVHGKDQEKLIRKIIKREVWAVVFSSSMMVQSFMNLSKKMGKEGEVIKALNSLLTIAIGPPTQKTLEKFDIKAVIPNRYNFEGIRDVLEMNL
jgi:uroporphyrinogen-III synthase